MPVRAAVALVVSLSIAVIRVAAQVPDASSPAQPYTFRAKARAVVTDVLVLDHHGDPIHGLKVSDFRLLDNGQPQRLSSFEEHSGLPAFKGERPLPPGSFSNSVRQHLPPSVNVLVIDIANLELPDQMYLSFQLGKFLDHLPADVPLALYLEAGQHNVLLQDFTADHAKLLDAVHHALPSFPSLGRGYSTDTETLHQIAMDLAAVPGRKNVLWFSGGSRLTLNPAGMVTTPGTDMRLVYDELEAARIAVYPIDARGLMVRGPGGLVPQTGGTVQDVSTASDGTFAQHGLMQDVATATGGLPFYNTNGVWQAAMQAVETGHDFYTLSYAPQGLQFDNKWHTVRVTVNGHKAQLSYRRGYFADGTHVDTPTATRTVLLAGNRTQAIDLYKRTQPIVFRAVVQPVSPGAQKPGETAPAPGQTRYAIHYLLPGRDFTPKTRGGESEVVLGIGFMATDRNGSPLVEHAQKITYTVNEAKLQEQPDATIPVVQQLDLNKGDTYLYLQVWDTESRRVGTLTVPLKVPAAR